MKTCLIKKNILESFFLSDQDLKDEIPMEYLSHKERYEQAVRKSCILFKKVNEWQQIDSTSSNSMEVYKYEKNIPIKLWFIIIDIISDHF